MKQLPSIQKNMIPNKGRKQALNIFLIQNKGKGPPGGAGSPETDYLPIPDCKNVDCKGSIN